MWPVIINGLGICYVKCLCVVSCYLSSVVEILVITGMFGTSDKKCIKKHPTLCLQYIQVKTALKSESLGIKSP